MLCQYEVNINPILPLELKPLKSPRPNVIETSPLHPRNRHRERYDFESLIQSYPDLAPFITLNKHKVRSIDFFNPSAVKALNKALLLHYYGLTYWDIPAGFLCPPVPGRADYIHYMADTLAEYNQGKIPLGKKITGLDIGIGANAIYPIIGIKEYGWDFIGTDVHEGSLANAQQIIQQNSNLKEKLKLRKQADPNKIFQGILEKDEFIDLVVCNPPFHDSKREASEGSDRKIKNLTGNKSQEAVLNFGGQDNELWRKGGELRFALDMIKESVELSTSFFLISTYISKEIHLKPIFAALKKANATEVQTVIMGQGQKLSRIVVWSFLSPEQIKQWSQSKQ